MLYLLTLVAILSSAASVCGDESGSALSTSSTVSPSAQKEGQTTLTPVYRYRVVHTYPHDRGAYTQGLLFHDGFLYESTGQRGQSSLRKVDLATGRVLQIRALDSRYFGEGITLFQDRIIQLTWTSGIGFVYDKESFDLLREFTVPHTELGGLSYPSEGWGITHDGKRLIMSDGTEKLRFWDPETFEEIGTLDVHDENGPIIFLNELEYINGEIYANVWQTDRIARISPETGRVLSWIDLTGIISPFERGRATDNVLNGIAYDADGKRLFVTGKRWPKLFEIELIPPK
jgi:glutamine cyclotransferase